MKNERAVAVTVAGLGLLAFGSPLRVLWARADAPWWTAFVLWGVLVAVLFASARREGR